jgi:O-antigen ligase
MLDETHNISVSTDRWTFAIAGVVFFGILTLWVQERWALAAYQAAVLGIALCWALRMVARPFPMRGSWSVLLLAGPAVCGLVQLATAHTAYRWDTWNSVLVWTVNWVLFSLTLQCGAESGRWFRNAVLYFSFAVSVLSLLQMFTSEGNVYWLFPSGYTDYVLGPFVNRNQYAAFIEMTLPLALYSAVENPRRSTLYWVMAAVMAASVVAAASRAGVVLVALETLTVLLLTWARGRAGVHGLLRFIALAAVCIAIAGWESSVQRFQAADPFAVRSDLLRSSVQMVREKPWTGFGMGTWPTVYPGYAFYDDGQFVNQAHNDWMQWTVEGGLPLLAAMVLFAVMLTAPAWNSVWGLGLLFVLMHCFVDYPMQQRPALSGFFCAIAGVLVGSRRHFPHASMLPGRKQPLFSEEALLKVPFAPVLEVRQSEVVPDC